MLTTWGYKQRYQSFQISWFLVIAPYPFKLAHTYTNVSYKLIESKSEKDYPLELKKKKKSQRTGVVQHKQTIENLSQLPRFEHSNHVETLCNKRNPHLRQTEKSSPWRPHSPKLQIQREKIIRTVHKKSTRQQPIGDALTKERGIKSLPAEAGNYTRKNPKHDDASRKAILSFSLPWP